MKLLTLVSIKRIRLIKKNYVNKNNTDIIIQCSPSQHSSTTTSVSSCVNLNTTGKSPFNPVESSIQVQLESTMTHLLLQYGLNY
ncbi:hypothetical protein Leryth_017135 [Lithospermum erythrorhizon]|nr:hypothetical protein Leryth_017135 [Lithospermum erythrorhizon]